jgi:hypothetical protein
MDTPHSYETLAKFCQIPQCHIAKYITFWFRDCWSLRG